jgi:hypothetical protein
MKVFMCKLWFPERFVGVCGRAKGIGWRYVPLGHWNENEKKILMTFLRLEYFDPPLGSFALKTSCQYSPSFIDPSNRQDTHALSTQGNSLFILTASIAFSPLTSVTFIWHFPTSTVPSHPLLGTKWRWYNLSLIPFYCTTVFTVHLGDTQKTSHKSKSWIVEFIGNSDTNL